MKQIITVSTVVVLATIAAISVSTQVSNAQTTQKATSSKDVVMSLESAMTVDNALDVARSEDARPTEVIARYEFGDREYSAGYFLGKDNAPVSEREVTQAMLAMFENNSETIEKEVNKSNQKADKVAASDLDSVIRSLEQKGAKVEEVEGSTTASIEEIEKNPNVAEATSDTVEDSTASQNQEPAFSAQQADRTGPTYAWAPRRGSIFTGCCSAGKRYVRQSFSWNSKSLRALKNKRRGSTNITYEADALYPRAGGTYLGARFAWSSNLRDGTAFVDTELSDSFTGTDRVLTIGTSQAMTLRANKTYITYFLTENGNADSDRGGANGQFGRRKPSFCYSKFCIFGVKSDLLILQKNYRVPGYRSY